MRGSRLEQLLKLAEDEVGEPQICTHFHRAKHPSYFEVDKLPLKTKDGGGDPQCPINGELSGVYFYANNKYGGFLPQDSPFGKKQIAIPVQFFLRKPCNLYFADFFCTSSFNPKIHSRKRHSPHYVTLVMALSGTTSDKFCKRNLIQLDVENNKFLWVDVERKEIRTRNWVWIEVFYTEEVDVKDALKNGAMIRDIEAKGKGRSTRGGKRKGIDCSKCNVTATLDPRKVQRLNNSNDFPLTNEVMEEIETNDSSVDGTNDATGADEKSPSSDVVETRDATVVCERETGNHNDTSADRAEPRDENTPIGDTQSTCESYTIQTAEGIEVTAFKQEQDDGVDVGKVAETPVDTAETSVDTTVNDVTDEGKSSTTCNVAGVTFSNDDSTTGNELAKKRNLSSSSDDGMTSSKVPKMN